MCMCAHNYDVEIITNHWGNTPESDGLQGWLWTRALPCIAGFINCYTISQLDFMQSSCHHGTGNPVDCAR